MNEAASSAPSQRGGVRGEPGTDTPTGHRDPGPIVGSRPTPATHPARRIACRRRTVLFLACALTVTSTSCQPREQPVGGGWVREAISAPTDLVDHGHTYEAGIDSIRVTAGPIGSADVREAFVRTDTPVSVDQQSCVTWHGPIEGSATQPGVVLRADPSPDRTRMIMVTNNVAFEWRPALNVHLVDSPDGEPVFRKIASRSLTTIGSWDTTQPLPWRLCARAVGRWVEAKAWSLTNEEPSWIHPSATITVLLPPEYVRAGRPGVYVGHLGAHESTLLTDHRTADLAGERTSVLVERSLARLCAWSRERTVRLVDRPDPTGSTTVAGS